MTLQDIFSIVIPLILAIFSASAWVYTRLDKRFDNVDRRFDRLEIEIKEMRTGLNRMEGAFYSKDCCMLKEEKTRKGKHFEFDVFS